MKTKKPEKRYCSYCGQEMILEYVLPDDDFKWLLRYDERTGRGLAYPRYICPSYVEYANSHWWALFSHNPHDNYILEDGPILFQRAKNKPKIKSK